MKLDGSFSWGVLIVGGVNIVFVVCGYFYSLLKREVVSLCGVDYGRFDYKNILVN